MPNNLRLIADLSDGSTVVGSFIYIQQTRPYPQCFDPSIHKLPEPVGTLAILSDTLGRIEINVKHIVRIGTDQTRMVVIKNPVDALIYVNELLQTAQNMPLNYL